MINIDNLFRYLDQQFLNETDDMEEEQWEEMRIGAKSVAEFANELMSLAERLEKNGGANRTLLCKGIQGAMYN